MMAGGRNVHRFCHAVMGTVFETVVAETDETYARQASQAFFSEIDRLEGCLSRFDPGSDLGQINLLRAGQSILVCVDVYECLKKALELQGKTKGAFDINYRIRKSRPRHSASSRLEFCPEGAAPAFELSSSTDGFRIIYKSGPPAAESGGLDLDLGGIGKGYALDKAAELFSDWGIEHVLIHAGTSTAYACGSASGIQRQPQGWPVGIGGNWPSLRKKKFILKNRALSGSGTDVKGKHIYDSRKGKQAAGHLAAWVAHPSAAEADALSTAFMVMNREEVAFYCQNNPETWALVLIDPEHFEVYNKNRFLELAAD